MKYTYPKNKAISILAGITASLFILTACSSSGDDAAQVIADEFISISGKLTSSANPTGETGVTVKGIYSDGNILNPETATDPAGVFSLDVLKNTLVSLQASKSGFVTLNSAKEALSVNESGVDIELVTSSDAEAAVAAVFAGPELADVAWLAVNVVDSSGAQVDGVTISTTGTAIDTAATACDGTDSNFDVTIAPCLSRDGPMYFAYFDIDSTEVTVMAGSDSQLALVRRGEVTFLEFEAVAVAPVGTIVAGQAKYDADCASCHAAGTYDTTTSNGASDLIGKSSLLITNISLYSPAKKTGVVADLSPQEILDLTVFLESL